MLFETKISMRQQVNNKSTDPQELARSEEIQRQMQALSGRDLQLWSITFLIILVLASGFLAMVFPNMSWRPGIVHVEERYLPQFFFGLITLVLLFNIYVMSQKRTINATRRELVRELVFNERMESVSMVDPQTQLLNRRSLDVIVSHEAVRANRLGTNLTFLILNLDSLKTVKARHGTQAGEEFLMEVAKLVKDTFRGSDRVLRYGEDQFLVVLPDTNEQESDPALRRLLTAVDHWNLTSKTGWEISFSYGVAPYVSGTEFREGIHAAMRKMLLERQQLIPVFMEVPAKDPASPTRTIL
jgi:diguanylate cyclase (GGDEF)-like protein